MTAPETRGATLVPSLDELREAGFFEPLDVHLARSLAAAGGETDPRVLLAAALASRGPQTGQVCVLLREPPSLEPVAEEVTLDGDEPPRWSWPGADEWAEVLRRSPLVGDGRGRTPLVLDDELRLYLFRYFRYQQRLGASLLARAAQLETVPNRELLREGLDRFFGPREPGSETDWQRVSAVMTVLRRLSVISGGPGTGKTSTVLKILALLQEQARAAGTFPLRVTLLAPTGKAAARLAESIKGGKAKLAADGDIKGSKSIPDEAATIHRCLGYQPARPTRFFHDGANPLPADVVVVDESSMVDLALMAKLVDAVPSRARLILLGDRDQLASVEAGAILGDICNVGEPARERSWSIAFRERAAEVTGEPALSFEAPPAPAPGIADCLVHLSKSYRFGEQSGIGALARAIKNEGPDLALAYLDGSQPAAGAYPDLEWIPLDETSQPAIALGDRLTQGFLACLEKTDPLEALAELGRFRVLCAHRRGVFGVEAINELVRDLLALKGEVPSRGQWYHGRPVMITRNDYNTGLFNGDVGLTLADGSSGGLLVHFPAPDGKTTRSFHPARLPAHETAFALTVHKSQGSEFDDVLLLLPRRVSPILSRELLYTGVTRAKKRVAVAASAAVIREAVTRRIQRASGLRGMLWEQKVGI